MYAQLSIFVGRLGNVVQDVFTIDVVRIVLERIPERDSGGFVVFHIEIETGGFVGFPVKSLVQVVKHCRALGSVGLSAVVLLIFCNRSYRHLGRCLVQFISVCGPVEAVDSEESGVFCKRTARKIGDEPCEVCLRGHVILEAVIAQAPVILDGVISLSTVREH